MNLFELAKGRKIEVETNMKVNVILEVAKIEESRHSVDLEPATPANDWWPASRDWSTYVVHFTNGSTKEYSSLSAIKFI